MANLQIKNIDEDLYKEIKRAASAENRSVSQQVLTLIRDYLAKRNQVSKLKTPAQVLLELSGTWEDERSAEEIVRDIRKARRNSKKLSGGF
jgi:plasmid stability protein